VLACRFKCGDQDGSTLHTCLIVPTLQTDLNRAVVFWASPKQKGMDDAMHGYAVVHYPTTDTQGPINSAAVMLSLLGAGMAGPAIVSEGAITSCIACWWLYHCIAFTCCNMVA
jgi:hypothetical protein